ncbi:MAG TPA: DUF4040 domain-containing protein [Oceanospirillaceae bacterium]|nr:DUF4040 domain-containing protein [Oceanospirillaceae bacterium]
MNTILVLVLFGLLLATAVVIARLTDLFAAAMLTGIFSLLSAGLFTLMDAVDVAFTEAAVGAGISTILVLGTLSMTSRREDQQPVRLLPLALAPRMSCKAHKLVSRPSIMPSGTSSPWALSMALLVIKWPTFRTNNKLRPCRLKSLPWGSWYWRSALSVRVMVLPFLLSSMAKSPFMSPSQLRYTITLSSASTAVTESSQSIIVDTAASIMMSLTPARSVVPITC